MTSSPEFPANQSLERSERPWFPGCGHGDKCPHREPQALEVVEVRDNPPPCDQALPPNLDFQTYPSPAASMFRLSSPVDAEVHLRAHALNVHARFRRRRPALPNPVRIVRRSVAPRAWPRLLLSLAFVPSCRSQCACLQIRSSPVELFRDLNVPPPAGAR